MIDFRTLDPARQGDWTRAYMRVPFVDRGRAMTGADCWGLARLIYSRDLGIDLPSFADGYTDTAEVRIVAAVVARASAAMPLVPVLPRRGADPGDGYARAALPRLKPFDILEIKRLGELCHVGIWAGGGRFIHAEDRRGVCVTALFEKDWARRLMAAWRHRDVIAGAGWTV